MSDYEKHHVLFPKRLWVAQKTTGLLRSVPELIPEVDTGHHRNLHRAVSFVPIIGRDMVNLMVKEFYPVRNDPLATLDNLSQATRAAMEHRNTSGLDYRAGQLFILSLSMQLPFIEDGLYE